MEFAKVFFAVTDVDVNPLIPVLVAFVISFFTSMGGVSGAFLLLPFQVSFLGFSSPAVSATNQLFNVVAIPSGVYRYVKEGRMVWPLAWIVVIGTLPGVFVGTIVRIQYLPDPRHFKMFVAVVLLYIGVRLVRDILGRNGTHHSRPSAQETQEDDIDGVEYRAPSDRVESVPARSGSPKVLVREVSLHRIAYEFQGETFHADTMGVMGLSLVVGIVGGIYGIGGGAIIAPFFVSFFRLPVHTVAGATLMGTFVTSVAGVLFYQIIAPFYPDTAVAPDYGLGLLFGVGGIAGMYLGARLQKHVPARAIKCILAGCILFTAVKYTLDFVNY